MVPQCLHRKAYTNINSTTKDKAIADLATIAFLYLLRVGEYTQDVTPKLDKSNARKQTVNFRVQDVGFFKNGTLLPRDSPLETLLTSDAATLKITNQKNGKKGDVVHHKALSNLDLCPV